MSLGVFKDAGQIYPVTAQRPLTFLLPQNGGVKESSLFLSLDGYAAGSILKLEPVGGDLSVSPPPYTLTVKLSSDSWQVVLPNNPYLFSLASQTTLQFSVRIDMQPGALQLFLGTSLRVSILTAGVLTQSEDVICYILRAEQRLRARFRILAAGRQLEPALPGFVLGDYRWRDDAAVNAHTLVPSDWDIDVSRLSASQFVSGIGDRDDLQLERLYRSNHSIYPVIRDGAYFLGPQRYFCPSKDFRLEIWPATTLLLRLAASPARQKPLFIGTYRTDNAGSYQSDAVYRGLGHGLDTADGWDPLDSGLQYKLDRRSRTLILNRAVTGAYSYAGLVPAAETATIYLPVYPVWSLLSLYVGDFTRPCVVHSFDPVTGAANVTFPEGTVGLSLTMTYLPAVAVLYETEPTPASDAYSAQAEERLLQEVDLNPAFSGLSHGILYLMHRQLRAFSLTLYADKPRILIPGSPSTNGVPDIAFGPVYYDNDYALLLVRAAGRADEPLSGIRLRVLPDSKFQGYLNGLDPLLEPIEAVTGADGNAVLVYTPPKGYGYYLDIATSVTGGNVLHLPAPLLLNELWNANQGWLTSTYVVYNNSPVLGKVGANVAFGEVAWATVGTPGTISYRTNGQRRILVDENGNKIQPVQVFDLAAQPAFELDGSLNPLFSGMVSTLQFLEPLPFSDTVPALFLAFSALIQLRVEEIDTGLKSNSILLELAAPPMLGDMPGFGGYLYLNTATLTLQGRLNANRLGGAPISLSVVYAPRY